MLYVMYFITFLFITVNNIPHITATETSQNYSLLSTQPLSSDTQENSKITTTPAPTPVKRRITSRIGKNNLGYYKMFMYHYPSEFTLYINGNPIGENETVIIPGKKIIVEYKYVWHPPWGKHRGGKRVSFELPDTLTDAEIFFSSWDTEERITIPGAIRTSREIIIDYMH